MNKFDNKFSDRTLFTKEKDPAPSSSPDPEKSMNDLLISSLLNTKNLLLACLVSPLSEEHKADADMLRQVIEEADPTFHAVALTVLYTKAQLSMDPPLYAPENQRQLQEIPDGSAVAEACYHQARAEFAYARDDYAEAIDESEQAIRTAGHKLLWYRISFYAGGALNAWKSNHGGSSLSDRFPGSLGRDLQTYKNSGETGFFRLMFALLFSLLFTAGMAAMVFWPPIRETLFTAIQPQHFTYVGAVLVIIAFFWKSWTGSIAVLLFWAGLQWGIAKLFGEQAMGTILAVLVWLLGFGLLLLLAVFAGYEPVKRNWGFPAKQRKRLQLQTELRQRIRSALEQYEKALSAIEKDTALSLEVRYLACYYRSTDDIPGFKGILTDTIRSMRDLYRSALNEL